MKIERFYGIDTWRAALLIFGVMVHCAEVNKIEGHLSIFTFIIFMSHSFRMEAFFAVSGFLSASALQKDPLHFIISRFRIIVIPLCFMLGVIMPSLGFTVGSLHHLWFLANLMGANWLAYSLERIGIIEKTVAVINTCTDARLLAVLITLSLSLGFVCHLALSIFTGAGLITDAHDVVGTLIKSPYYTLYFFSGLYIARCSSIRNSLKNRGFTLIGIMTIFIVGTIFVCFYSTFLSIDKSFIAETFSSSIISLSAVIMTITVISTGLTGLKPPAIVMRTSAASYTIYLVHFPIIAVLNHFLRYTSFNSHVSFLILFSFTLLISFIVHEWILRHSAMLRLLLNGRGALTETTVYKTVDIWYTLLLKRFGIKILE